MCDDSNMYPSSKAAPEQRLADLMRADLGTTCSAREIRMFIRANWKRVTAYAHAIHDTDPNIGD